MGRYPDRHQIEEIFSNRDVPTLFHKYLADPLDIVVVGQDFHVGGHYTSMEAFHEGIYSRIADSLKIETIRVEVRRVVGGGDEPWAAVESLCTAEGKYGKPYHLEFVDLVRFNSEGKIAQMKEFLDSGHLHVHVDEHEKQTGEKRHPGHKHQAVQHTKPDGSAAPAAAAADGSSN